MRIMLDTNIIVSALLFPSEKMTHLFETIVIDHTMVLSSYVIDELYAVVERKFPKKAAVVERLLGGMSFELVCTPQSTGETIIYIRDVKDYPVIYTAIRENIDILITGDKDFSNLEIKKPQIMIPNEFLAVYGR